MAKSKGPKPSSKSGTSRKSAQGSRLTDLKPGAGRAAAIKGGKRSAVKDAHDKYA